MRLLLCALCALLFFSCKPYQSTIMKEGQVTYDRFRENQKTFNTTDGTIAYMDQGTSDKVVVLLHGVPTSGWLYRNMIDPLVAQGYRVIVPDMLGFGSSANPKGYEIYSEENHGNRLLALMDNLGIQNWTHVMHDAGGLWTWELIENDPTRIENLVILNTIIYEEGFEPPVRMKKGFFARTAMWGYRNGITTNLLLRGLFKSGLKENNLNKLDVEGYKTPLREGKTRGMYYFFTQTCNALPNYQPMIQKVDIPTTVIWGRHDDMLQWEPQKARVIRDLNIKPENIHLIDAKHFIQEEKPNEIIRLITSFLK